MSSTFGGLLRAMLFGAPLAVFAIGCVAAEDSGDELSWIVPPEEPAPSQLDLAAAPAAVDLVIGHLPKLNGAPMFDVYGEVMNFADGDCPVVMSDAAGGSLWDSRCTADSGASFSGFISEFKGQRGPNYEQNMRGEATVVLPDGRTFLIAGGVTTSANTGAREYASAVEGVFSWSGEARETAILVDGWEATLSWVAQYSGASQLLRFTADGSVAVPEGAVTAIAFDQVKFNNDASLGCSAEPAGEMALRDASGNWLSLVFDVTANADGSLEFAEGSCDGCGKLWDGGEELGELCVDLSSLFTAPFPPW